MHRATGEDVGGGGQMEGGVKKTKRKQQKGVDESEARVPC